MPAYRELSQITWELLVWHYLAVDGSTTPKHSTAGAAVQLDHRTARKAWEAGYPDVGRPPIKAIREDVVAGKLLHPPRPPGAPAPRSSLFHFLRGKKWVDHVDQTPDPKTPKPRGKGKPPPPAIAPVSPGPLTPPKPPPAPPTPTAPPAEDEVDWGDTPLDPAAAQALAAVSFPEEPTPTPPPAPAAPRKTTKSAYKQSLADELDSESEGFVQAAQQAAEHITPQNVDASAPGEVPHDLPSDVAANMGIALPPIDRALAEQLQFESRADIVDLSARNRRAGAMATWINQELMAAGVLLARRLKAEIVKVATAEDEKFDVDAGLRYMERLMKMGRAQAGIVTSAMVAERHALAELGAHIRTAEAAGTTGTSPSGHLTDKELLERARHAKERLERTISQVEKRAEGRGPGQPPPGSPPGSAPPAQDTPAAPPPPPVTRLLTVDALRGIADLTAQQGGQAYAAEGRVQRVGLDAAGALAAVVVGTFEYAVRLWAEDGALRWACTCPQGQHRPDQACKHVVATGLVWLRGREEDEGNGEEAGEAEGAEEQDGESESGEG